MVKFFDKSFLQLDELLGKEDWRVLSNFTLAPVPGKLAIFGRDTYRIMLVNNMVYSLYSLHIFSIKQLVLRPLPPNPNKPCTSPWRLKSHLNAKFSSKRCVDHIPAWLTP